MRCAGEWTLNTLRDHLLSMIDSTNRRNDERFIASAVAIEKADKANEKRLDALNELRGALSDNQKLFVQRAEWIAKHDSLMEKIDTLTARQTKEEGTGAGKNAFWGYIVGVIGLIGFFITIIRMFLIK